MGLFDFFKPKKSDLPKKRALNTLLGNVFFNKAYSNAERLYSDASSQIAVASAVRILSTSIASMPLGIYKIDVNGSKTLAKQHYLYKLLYRQPNPNLTSMEWRELMLNDLLYGGNHYCFLDYGIVGSKYVLKQIIPLSATSVNLRILDDYTVEYYVNGAKQERQNILHLKFNSKNGFTGASIIEQHRLAIDTMSQTEQYSNAFYRNGARLTGILETDNILHDEETFERMRSSFNELYGGVDNAYKVAVLEGGLKYKPISVSPRDAQYIEQKKYNIADVSRLFNVPLHMLAELDRATFSNIEQQNMEFVTHSLSPHMVRIEQSLMAQLLTPSDADRYIIEHDLSGLLKGDIETRYRVYQIARQNGLMSANEIRAREHLPPIDLGDEILVNSAMQTIRTIVEGGNVPNAQQGQDTTHANVSGDVGGTAQH